jgi:hypothetical protein
MNLSSLNPPLFWTLLTSVLFGVSMAVPTLIAFEVLSTLRKFFDSAKRGGDRLDETIAALRKDLRMDLPGVIESSIATARAEGACEVWPHVARLWPSELGPLLMSREGAVLQPGMRMRFTLEPQWKTKIGTVTLLSSLAPFLRIDGITIGQETVFPASASSARGTFLPVLLNRPIMLGQYCTVDVENIGSHPAFAAVAASIEHFPEGQ